MKYPVLNRYKPTNGASLRTENVKEVASRLQGGCGFRLCYGRGQGSNPVMYGVGLIYTSRRPSI